jgi:putative copper export protein
VLNVLVFTPAVSTLARREQVRLTSIIIKRITIIVMICVLVLIGTGFHLAENRLGSPPELFSQLFNTTYGQVLLAKLFMMLAMIVIGAIIGFVIEPRMRAATCSAREAAFEVAGLERKLRILSVVEMLLGVLVLLSVAILHEL